MFREKSVFFTTVEAAASIAMRLWTIDKYLRLINFSRHLLETACEQVQVSEFT